MEPETRYATASGFHIAYQALGEGPPQLLMVPGLFSHLEMQWRLPTYRRFMRALARRCCLIRFDKRGTGLSDPVASVPDMEERIAEVEAVMDALHIGSTALFGFSEGGPIALHFAASHPDRVSALVLYGTYARKPPDAVMRQLSEIGQRWGTGETFTLFAPEVRSPSLRQLGAAIERASASPAMFQALVASLALTNVRPLLPRITAPTLVLHRDREYIPVEEARTLAAGIRGARLVELEGADHHPWAGDWRRVIEEIGMFLGDVLPAATRQVTRRARRSGRAAESARPARGWPSLTPAEQAVVELVTEGLSNRAIADRLVLSRYTVETHLKHVFAKLGVSTRAELAAGAARRG